jgi:hypothetical protein
MLVSLPLSFVPPTPPIPLKAIARGFFVLFHIGLWSPPIIYPHLNLLHSHFPIPQVPPHTVPILQSCLLLLLIFKSIFQGVSQCVPTVSLLYFGPLDLFHCSPLPFASHPQYFNRFHRCYVLWYCWYCIIPLFFPFFPKFHRVFPLLQTCSTYEFVRDHGFFCVCISLSLVLFSIYERKHATFVFLNLGYFT